MRKFIQISDKKIGKNFPVFVIAEASANHMQKFANAVKIIKAAKKAGADAVKFQTYTPDTLTLNLNTKYFKVKHPQWGGQTLYQLYEKAYTPWKWFKKLKKVADDVGIVFFSTAFDKTAVNLLEEINVPVHKIASFELVDLPLIEYVAKTKKPLIISTGMANVFEIKQAIYTARNSGAKEIILLKCVSNYPANPKEMNLRTIPHMSKKFGVPVGLSDHTLESAVSVAAVSLGAVVIEKHITLSRDVNATDSFFSTEPQELKDMIKDIRLVEKALGRVNYGTVRGEAKSKTYRRSLFAVEDIKKGEMFCEKNVRSIRPGYGLAPCYLNQVFGQRARKNIAKGTPLTRTLLKSSSSKRKMEKNK
ncbi:MAG: pseudaminic acid synthase [Candidatus Omnitrophica bacterium]|nr:pseudaminic acid synthase [Candidatus Omnitrophota bacterium]